MTTLYRKEGRRYVVHCHEQQWNWLEDTMRPGQFRLTYCYSDGGRRYSYDVRPDTASFVAACELAGEAMERAIQAVVTAHPAPPERPYTKRQRYLVAQFQADMKACGGFAPHWWEYSSAREIAQAGIDAVRNWTEK